MAKKKSKKKFKNKIKKIIATIAVIIIIGVVLLCYFYPPAYEFLLKLLKGEPEPEYRVDGDTTYVEQLDDLKIHFVDVGQGDCIIIELPDYKNVLIDAGQANHDDLYNYIDELEIKTFDYVILTHGDSDHVGNMDKIIQKYDVKHVFRPHVRYTGDKYSFSDEFNKGGIDEPKNTVAYGDFLNELLNEKYKEGGVDKSATWSFFNYNSDFAGKVSCNDVVYEYYFDFLSPRKEVSQINYKDANDYSPIIKFSYGTFDIMLTGDAEALAEEEFVDYYSTATDIVVDVDVLKVSHHGSHSSTTQAFLDLVNPEYAVIQCGVGNDYLHPRQVTLDRLMNADCALFRNDLNGDIVLTVNSSGEFEFDVAKQDYANLFVGGETLYGED